MNISTSIYTELLNALLSNRRYASADKDPKLLRNSVIEDALKMDKELIQVLLDNPKLKSKFFTEINGVLVFDKIEFNYVINNKEFLPDSYTRFKQKIGLIDSHGEFITEKNDVVLSFPYKDCVLEGGQTKEDQDRDEIFYNETLAPDEVDCLLAPKVFTNAKRYTKEGVSSITEFNDDDNLLIKGNNLLVLSCLLKRYDGKVKLIYIDPPYNTANDSFNYNDSFNHSTWLTFMKNRLEIAKQLLRDDGVICIQCDDNEQAYLKVLCDDIFGRDNFINNISVNMSNMSNTKVTHAILGKRFPKLKEYILIYTIDKNLVKFNIPKLTKEKWDNEYNKIIPRWTRELNIKYENDKLSDDDILGLKYESLNDYIKKNNIKDDTNFKTENAYRIFATKPNESLLNAAKKLKISSSENQISLVNNKLIIKNFNTETETARIELLNAETKSSIYLGDNWTDITTTGGIAQEGNVILKKGKKPEKLIKRIIESCSCANDLILDFFVGSGTTAAVAHKMNRKYIGIEQLDYIETLTEQRLLNVLKGDPTGISKEVNWQGGGSFVYCELKELNQKFIRKISDATSEQLNSLYSTIIKSDFISTKVDPKDLFSDEVTGDFTQLDNSQKKEVLLKLLDLNMLYVNYSDLDDADYNISEEDKKFSRSFYGDKE